ncbi:MAG: hypothetical protein SEPTF4163_000499 [Sporothrix epigloea]
MASADRRRAATPKSRSSEIKPRPPDATDKGILRGRAFNIPSSQKKILGTDLAWLDGHGHTSPGFKPVPDNLLKRLQEAARTKQQSSLTPAKRAPLSQETTARNVTGAASNLNTSASSPVAASREEVKIKSAPRRVTESPVTVQVATPKQATQTIPLGSSALRSVAKPPVSTTSWKDGKTPTPTATRKRPLELKPGHAMDDGTGTPARSQTTAATSAEVLIHTIETEPDADILHRQCDPPDSPDWSDERPSGTPVTGSQNVAPKEAGVQRQEDQHQQPPLAATPRSIFLQRELSPGNIACGSSPSIMDVELPDALVERRTSMPYVSRQRKSPHNLQRPPSSSPSHPETPASMLRRKKLQPLSPANMSADENSHFVTNSPEPSHAIATMSPVASRESGQPRQRLMKAPVFPTNAMPLSKARHSMADLQTSSHIGRRLSLVGGSIPDQPPNSTGKIKLSKTRAKNRDDSGDISRRETSFPAVTTAPAVAALSLPEDTPISPPPGAWPVKESRDAVAALAPAHNSSVASAVIEAPVKDSKTAQPGVSAPRTWMLPFDAFTAAYPDYKGDLEDFLRACYSLRHTSPGALPSFLFDDIVHAFLDYIDYIHGPPSADRSPPQNLTQWYNFHATGLNCKKSVVTRENVAKILRAYPDEVWAIEQNAAAPDKKTDSAVVASTTKLASPASVAKISTPGPSSHTQEQRVQQDQHTPHHSFPPGRHFPYEEKVNVSSQGDSSGRPNSLLHTLRELRTSEGTSESGLRSEQVRAQSPPPHGLLGGDYSDGETNSHRNGSQGPSTQGQSPMVFQGNPGAALGQAGHHFGATQSTLSGDSYYEPLELPSPPIVSDLVPPNMDKRFYMMQTPQLTRPRLPSTQEFAGHEQLIKETPARTSQKRSRQQLDRSRPAADEFAIALGTEKPADSATQSQISRQNTAAEPAADERNDDADVYAVSHAVDNAKANEEEDTDVCDTTVMSVQSAVEPSRPLLSLSPPAKRNAVASKGRRVTLAAPDLGMVARMAAAEEVDKVARKRKLPPSMARASEPAVFEDETPPRASVQVTAAITEKPLKKKKKSRQSTGSDYTSTFEKFRELLGKKRASGLI